MNVPKLVVHFTLNTNIVLVQSNIHNQSLTPTLSAFFISLFSSDDQTIKFSKVLIFQIDTALKYDKILVITQFA